MRSALPSACHMSLLLWTPIPVLSFATGHSGLHPRCVIWSLSTTEVTHPLCIHACKCVCAAILLSSSLCCLPLVGHDTDRVSLQTISSPERQIYLSNHASNSFCIYVNLLGVNHINTFQMSVNFIKSLLHKVLHILSLIQLEVQEVK